MSISGTDFGMTLAINGAVGLVSTLAFAFFRQRPWARKFYSPKEYLDQDKLDPLSRPRRMRPGFLAWIPQLFSAGGEEVISTAGIDAWTFVRVCNLAIQLFLFVTVWCGATCLVANMMGKEVSNALAAGGKFASDPYAYTYWAPAPPPAGAKKAKKPDAVPTPDFFENDAELPPRPPGLDYKQYRADVPAFDAAKAVEYLRNGSANKVKDYTDEEIARFVFYRDQTAKLDSSSLNDIDKVTIANVRDHSPALWVHAVTAWVVTAATLFLLSKFSKEAVALRLRYLSTAPKGAETHSILVTDVPGVAGGTIAHRVDKTLLAAVPEAQRVKVRGLASRAGGLATKTFDAAASAAGVDTSGTGAPSSLEVDPWGKAAAFLGAGGTPESLVEKEFGELYPGEVAHVQGVYNTSAIDPLLAEYNGLKLTAEDLLDDYTAQKRRGVDNVKRKERAVRGAVAGAWARDRYGVTAKQTKKVDAVQYCVDRMTFLAGEIKAKQAAARAVPDPAAFVTFADRRTQVLATQALHHHDTSVWHVTGAPAPGAVLWPALAQRSWERTIRTVGVWGAFIALCLLYLIPVGAIQKWVTSAGSILPSTGPLKIVSGLATGMLPPLVLVIFIALMPPILRLMGRVQGAKSEGELDRGVISKFFIFQVIVVFFGSFVGGAMFDTLKDWGEDPQGAVRSLARSTAGVSTFFLNYIAIKALFAQAFKCLRIVPFIVFAIRSKLAATERSKARVWSEQYMIYGVEIPQLTVVLLLGLVFCAINPLVPAVALIYFVTTLFFQKYRVMYVARPRYQDGGAMWAQVFRQVMTALYLFQLVMLGLLGIKRSPAAVSIPVLAVLTMVGHKWVSSIFTTPLSTMSLRAAVDCDAADAAAGGEAPTAEATRMYVSPGMAFDGKDLDALKAEAATVDAVLAGRERLATEEDEAAREAAADKATEAAFQRQRTLVKQQSKLQRQATRGARRAARGGSAASTPARAAAAPAAAAEPNPFTVESAPAATRDVEAGLPPSSGARNGGGGAV